MDPRAREILERVRRFALPGPISGGRGTWLRQRGEVRLDLNRPWPFRAEQRIDAAKLGYHWKARVQMARHVCRCHGRLRARPGVNLKRAREQAAVGLARYFEEAKYFEINLSR